MNIETAEAAGILLAAIGLLVVVLLVWIIVVSAKLRRITRQYRAMIGGTGVADLESVIGDLQRRAAAGEQERMRHAAELERLAAAARETKGKIGVVRYNAFSGQGSDLSFSVAILNAERSGVVISGLHSREETYVYAKPVDKGDSAYPLTPEERQAINQAVHP